MADEPAFIYVRERRLPYETFDSDNHLYENRDALVKFIPREYDGIIKYIDINGRTKLAVRDVISDYIPNPTFGRVAVPGGFGQDVTTGLRATAGRTVDGGKVRAMPGLDAFSARADEGHGHRSHASLADARQRGRGEARGRS